MYLAAGRTPISIYIRRSAGLPIGVMAVNVSAPEFRNAAFLKGVFDVLAETGLAPQALQIKGDLIRRARRPIEKPHAGMSG